MIKQPKGLSTNPLLNVKRTNRHAKCTNNKKRFKVPMKRKYLFDIFVNKESKFRFLGSVVQKAISINLD